MEDRVSSALFYPRPDQPLGTAAVGTDLMFEAQADVRLRLRIFDAPDAIGTILFFHGNGETARDYDYAAREYNDLPVRLIVSEYRGYGPCSGTPTLDNYLGDAHPALDTVLARPDFKGPLVVMGRSLGSGPAIELASKRSEVDGLIIESGFAHVLELLSLVGVDVNQLVQTEEFGPQNLTKMKTIAVPTLIMHAELDHIISVKHAHLLYDACKASKKELVIVPEANHNDIQFKAGLAYFENIRALFSRLSA